MIWALLEYNEYSIPLSMENMNVQDEQKEMNCFPRSVPDNENGYK